MQWSREMGVIQTPDDEISHTKFEFSDTNHKSDKRFIIQDLKGNLGVNAVS